MVKNFECLTIPQGSSKPDLPSLEPVVMAQRTQYYALPLLVLRAICVVKGPLSLRVHLLLLLTVLA